MAQDPRLASTITITSKGLSGDNVAKVFNAVRYINVDFVDATINIIDATGSFYFPMTPLTTVTWVVAGTLHTLVMS